MKRARAPSTSTENDNAVPTEQRDQTSQMSVQQIASLCDAIDNEAAREIASALKKSVTSNQGQLRTLCTTWGADRRDGTRELRVQELRASLQAKLAERVCELQRQRTATSPPSFCFASATRTTLQRLQEIPGRRTLLARVIDHATYSTDSRSHVVSKMLQEAGMQVSADLKADQQTDACGYIASDAVQQLRQLALAEANWWWSEALPDYSSMECITKGQRVLQCEDEDRVLNSDQVNQLGREYCNIANRPRVEEEWWAGAVGLDHFLEGVIDAASEMLSTSGRSQHRWRAWIVNTQISRQAGSHWFTVAIGVQQAQKEEKPQARSAAQRPRASEAHPLARPSTADAEASACASQLAETYEWARTNAHNPDVAKWIEAWREWEAVEDTCSIRLYRDFCRKRGIKRKRETEDCFKKDDRAAFKRAVRQNLIEHAHDLKKGAQKKDHTLDEYFGKATAKNITWPEQEVPAVVTSPSSAYLRMRLKGEHYRNDIDFQKIYWALNLGRNNPLSRTTRKTILQKVGHLIQRENMYVYLPRHATSAAKHRTLAPSTQWTTYHLQLALMREARRWLSDAERLDAISEAPETPKTLSLFASSLQKKKLAQYRCLRKKVP